MAAAKKSPTVIYETLLPDGRGFRFVKVTSKVDMEITERAAGTLPVEKQQQPIPMGLAIQVETLASCSKGITHRPLELKFKPVAPTEEGEKPKPPEVDLEATMVAARANDKLWRELGYATLIAEGPDNLHEVFEDPVVRNVAFARIRGAEGAIARDPFAGLGSTRSTG